VEDKYTQNDHLVDSIVEGLVLSLESSEADTSSEGILPLIQFRVMWTRGRND
jgi:hypothetical protein